MDYHVPEKEIGRVGASTRIVVADGVEWGPGPGAWNVEGPRTVNFGTLLSAIPRRYDEFTVYTAHTSRVQGLMPGVSRADLKKEISGKVQESSKGGENHPVLEIFVVPSELEAV